MVDHRLRQLDRVAAQAVQLRGPLAQLVTRRRPVGAGAGAGIAWLCGGDYEAVIHTIVNALAITSGIVCDGAKASCAAKISAAVDAGILGFEMYRNGQQFYGGDGLVLKGVENTIRNISRLGRVGMKETDKEINNMMIGQ